MKVFQPEFRLYALLVCTALVTACTSPGYNDNPSQQMTNARIGCLASTDFFAVYFSVHLQPPDENQNARLTKELFRSYCQDIPTPGKVFFTADLVGNEPRSMPIGIRIVEQEFTGGDESDAENFKDLRTISEVLAKTYSKGVIESHFDLDTNGHYAIYLIKGGTDAVPEQDILRIPLNVGADSGVERLTTRIVSLFGIASGLALIGFAASRFRRRRKIL
ncbi:hypothetical protein [Methylocaldum sp. RMAD-M]|uniref:hypothetical protein n=1 Tax=Methylocaldum sp. RMAD-M TaxID=2806557 RepID=UPI001AEACD4A|nr:hypothetical protein [Methylocaldum sp. RMAD-M]MBP1149973.1 hypothetical protein [Methylocaldum sp. RMAD-M]